jgi:hypothetical protein
MRWLLESATYRRPDDEYFMPFAPLYFAVVALPSANPAGLAPLPLKNVKPLGAATRICRQASKITTTPLGLTAMAAGLYVWMSEQPQFPLPE